MPNATKMKGSLRNNIYFNFLASGVKPYTIAWIYEIMLDDIFTFCTKFMFSFQSCVCINALLTHADVVGGQHLTAVSSSSFQECGLNFMLCALHTWDILSWYVEKSHDSNGSDALRLMPHTALEKAKDKNNLVLSNERHFHTTQYALKVKSLWASVQKPGLS